MKIIIRDKLKSFITTAIGTSNSEYIDLNFTTKDSTLTIKTSGPFGYLLCRVKVDNVRDPKDTLVSVPGKEFSEIISLLKNRDTISFKFDLSSVSIISGKMINKFTTSPLLNIDSVFKGSKPVSSISVGTATLLAANVWAISSSKSQTIFKENHAMTVDSAIRECISLFDMESSSFPKSINSAPFYCGMPSKQLEYWIKVFNSLNIFIEENKYNIHGYYTGNSSLHAIGFNMKNSLASILCKMPILSDTAIAKELSILDLCINHNPSGHIILEDTLELRSVSSCADVSEQDTKLSLSNLKNNDILVISTASGSIYDEIKLLKANCKLDICIRNVNLIKILQHIGPGNMEATLDKDLPIFGIKAGRAKFYISCFKNAVLGIDYKVEIDEKDSLVGVNSKSTEDRPI